MAEETTTKKKDMRGRHTGKGKHEPWKKSPVIGNNGLNVNEGDNTKFIQLNLTLRNLPKIDLHNADEVNDRINEYFTIFAQFDTKPTVAGLALALNGMSRQTLSAIVHDRYTGGNPYKTALPDTVSTLIKETYSIMEALWENYTTNGKINPVSSIFLAKNNFGYVDKVEHEVSTTQRQETEYSADEIVARYKEVTPEIAESKQTVIDVSTTKKELISD